MYLNLGCDAERKSSALTKWCSICRDVCLQWVPWSLAQTTNLLEQCIFLCTHTALSKWFLISVFGWLQQYEWHSWVRLKWGQHHSFGQSSHLVYGAWFAVLVLDTVIFSQMDIKYHLGLVSYGHYILTIKFLKAEIPKSLAVFKVRQTRRLLNLCSDYIVVVVAAVLRGWQLVVIILWNGTYSFKTAKEKYVIEDLHEYTCI